MPDTPTRLRVLVAITSYGNANDRYLKQLIQEYESMSFDIDLVVLSNISKQLPSRIEVIVGLPTSDPWSLPFAHKQVFADRRSDYDLFVYSEDDILITENNLYAFIRASCQLDKTEIAGFFRIEKGRHEQINFPDVHAYFHWDAHSVRKRGEYTLAYFTNEHAGCYVLSKEQLAAALDSGGFLVQPHEGKYDLACSAATDPYTQCGFTKLIAISHLDDFFVQHLSNRYIGVSRENIGNFGVNRSELQKQVDALLEIAAGNLLPHSLFETDLNPGKGMYSKNFYEPLRDGILSVIPSHLNNVLSIGCGAGATEIRMLEGGSRVVAIPLDSVIGRMAEEAGIVLVLGDLAAAHVQLAMERFDCLLCINVLHLSHEPAKLLAKFSDLLPKDAVAIIQMPNMASFPAIWSLRRRNEHLKNLCGYKISGMQFASIWNTTRWCRRVGLSVEKIIWGFPKRIEKIAGVMPYFMKPFLASNFVLLARRRASADSVQ